MSDALPDTADLINALVAYAAELPACERCSAETYLIPAAERTYILGVAHDEGCPWLAEHKQSDAPHVQRRTYAIDDLTRIEQQRNQ